MRGKMFGWIVLIALMLIPVALFCCGVAFADDGSGESSSDLTALWVAITAIAITLLNLYCDVLKLRLSVIWAVKDDSVAWKLRCSLIALGLALWDTLKAAYSNGLLDGVISVLIAIIRRKLGIPTAMRKAGMIK